MVTLADDVTAALPELRAAAESLHRDTFTVHRPTGETVTVGLTETPVYETVHEGVKGKLQSGQAQTRETETPGVKVAETSLFWHTSVTVLGILTDDEVECTASEYDPALVGTRVRVTGPHLKSIATARRFPVSELT
jgi:hypothetical protein